MQRAVKRRRNSALLKAQSQPPPCRLGPAWGPQPLLEQWDLEVSRDLWEEGARRKTGQFGDPLSY